MVLAGVVLSFTADGLGIMAGHAFVAMMAAAVLGFIIFLNLSGHVLIGADGVYVDRRDDQRFIPFGEIKKIRGYQRNMTGKFFVGAKLTLHTGEEYLLPIGEHTFGGTARANQLVARLLEARKRYRKCARDGAKQIGALKRGDRTPEQWLQRLRGIGEGANAAHREAPVPVEDLWDILENPVASQSERACAAAALAPKLDDDGYDRVRVALDETAAPKLRIALASALNEDDAKLAQALEEVEQEESLRHLS